MPITKLIMPFLSIFHIYTINLMINSLSEERVEEDDKRYFIRYIISYTIVAFFSTLIQKPILNLFASYTAIFIILNNYSNDIMDKTFNALYISTILLVSEIVVATILGYANISPLVNVEFRKVVDLITIYIFNYVVVICFIKLRKTKKHDCCKTTKNHLLIIPILSILLIILFYTFNQILPFQLAIVTALLFTVNIVTYRVYTNTVDIMNFQKDKELLEEQNSFYKSQIKLIKENEETIKSYKHDIKNHITVLKLLIEQNENDKAIEYLEEICDIGASGKKYISSGNDIIDNVVNYKLNLAKNEKIKFDIDISVSKKLFIPPYDITVILGNLLDNAIEACRELDESERKIVLKINENKSKLTIYIQNKFDKTLKKEHGDFATTKDDKNEHGYGIKNIKKSVEKNKGACEFDIVDENIFTVLIVFVAE